MSLATGIVRSVYEDLRGIVLAPYNLAKEFRYTYRGLQEGKIPPKYVAWTWVSTIGAVAVAALLMFPIYWVFTTAISGSGGSLYSTGGFELIPPNPSIKNFIWVIGPITTPSNIVINAPLIGELFSIPVPDSIASRYILDPRQFGVAREGTSGFIAFAENSMYVSFWTVLIAMAVIIPGAYGMSRRSFVGRKNLLYLYVLLTQVGGGLGIAILIALYSLFFNLGWLNELLPLGIYYAAGAVPFNTWLLKTYMDGIPISYEEAAIVDGAPSWRIVYEVIIPLSKAGLATVFVFIFLAGWTDFVIAQLMLSESNWTLPVGLYSLSARPSEMNWAHFSAFALAFATPLMMVYFFAQRYIESGLSFGGMEG
jgi:arabinogalactan oligomer/maltooligosaccharide transport system permease protein